MNRDHRAGQPSPPKGSSTEELQGQVRRAVQELRQHMGNPDSFVMLADDAEAKKYLAFGTADGIADLLGLKPGGTSGKGLFDDEQSSIH